MNLSDAAFSVSVYIIHINLHLRWCILLHARLIMQMWVRNDSLELIILSKMDRLYIDYKLAFVDRSPIRHFRNIIFA